MAVQFTQPYRFNEQQLARMAAAGVVPGSGTVLIDGVPYRGGSPIRFSNEDYHRLGTFCVLGADERVELIDGEVIQMTPVGGPHSTGVFDVDDYLHSIAGREEHVVMQSALCLPGAEPVPDVMLLRRADEVRGKLPTAVACMLVVEVADSSRWFDRNDKRELYARARIPEYWIVDLTTRTLVLHLHPIRGDYREVSEHPRGASFTSPALGGRTVRVADLLK